MTREGAGFGKYGKAFQEGLVQLIFEDRPFADQITEVFDVNFLGTFIMSREVAKAMIRKKWGRIINISTIAVPLRLEGEAVYTSSKIAIEAFTQILAKELAPYSITCNCVGPAPIKNTGGFAPDS